MSTMILPKRNSHYARDTIREKYQQFIDIKASHSNGILTTNYEDIDR